MNKRRALSVISAVVSVFFITTLFAGFTMSSKASTQALVYNLSSEPKSIDVSLNNASDGSKVIYACFENLVTIDPSNNLKPGVAKSWDVSKDGLTYTFHLRNNAKWTDGKQVTANDFYYSWTRLLNPKTAADYSYQAFYLKNAQKYYQGKAKIEDVGVKVVDPLTLKVTLEAPTPYFLKLLAYASFAPLRKDIVEGNSTWATKAETYVSNGPFKLTAWNHKDKLVFVKNPNYWNASAVKLNNLTFVEVTDTTIALQAWEKGDIDALDSVPTTETPRLISEKKIAISPAYSTYYLEFNTKRYPMSNVKFRQALSMVIDRQGIVTAITKAGQKPASALVPFGSTEPNGKDFRSAKSYPTLPASPNVAKAKQLLAESKVDLSKLNITYLYNSESDGHRKIAEAIQQMWKGIGVNVKLANQEFAVFQATKTAGNFDIARGGWNGDYLDPMTFLDMWTTGNGQNNPKYSNLRYDGLIAAAKKEVNLTKRMGYIHGAEDAIMNDLPIIPLYFYVNVLAVGPKVGGVYRLPTGGTYFDKAFIK